jgi:hypothetical protein
MFKEIVEDLEAARELAASKSSTPPKEKGISPNLRRPPRRAAKALSRS